MPGKVIQKGNHARIKRVDYAHRLFEGGHPTESPSGGDTIVVCGYWVNAVAGGVDHKSTDADQNTRFDSSGRHFDRPKLIRTGDEQRTMRSSVSLSANLGEIHAR